MIRITHPITPPPPACRTRPTSKFIHETHPTGLRGKNAFIIFSYIIRNYKTQVCSRGGGVCMVETFFPMLLAQFLCTSSQNSIVLLYLCLPSLCLLVYVVCASHTRLDHSMTTHNPRLLLILVGFHGFKGKGGIGQDPWNPRRHETSLARVFTTNSTNYKRGAVWTGGNASCNAVGCV